MAKLLRAAEKWCSNYLRLFACNHWILNHKMTSWKTHHPQPDTADQKRTRRFFFEATSADERRPLPVVLKFPVDCQILYVAVAHQHVTQVKTVICHQKKKDLILPIGKCRTGRETEENVSWPNFAVPLDSFAPLRIGFDADRPKKGKQKQQQKTGHIHIKRHWTIFHKIIVAPCYSTLQNGQFFRCISHPCTETKQLVWLRLIFQRKVTRHNLLAKRRSVSTRKFDSNSSTVIKTSVLIILFFICRGSVFGNYWRMKFLV